MTRWPRWTRRRSARAISALALLAPFAAAAPAGEALARGAALAIARSIAGTGRAIAGLGAATPPAPLPPTEDAARIAALDGQPANRDGETTEPPSPSPRSDALLAPPAGSVPRPVGVFVSKARVLAAARAGIRPSGTPVPATGWRPAGLALQGVGLLGVGLRDGDVLVSATSEGAVIGAVSAALRRHQRAVSGVAWRGWQRITITVELPDEEESR